MKNLRPFQIALLATFVFLALASLMLLRGFSPSGSTANNPYGDQVVLWGPFPYRDADAALDSVRDADPDLEVLEYVYVPPDQFAARFVNAIAEGRSPDLVILPHTQLVAQRSKLLPVPYDTDGFSERDIRDRYIDGASIFALQDGVYGVPYLVDPLVLYWNRDMFSSMGYVNAPSTWESLVGSVVRDLTIRDNSRNLMQSAVAFGEVENVRNAVPVLSLLLLQAGSQMVIETDRGYEVALNESTAEVRPPLEAVAQFYTDFAQAANPLYSWNRALEQDRLAFTAGDLALYFGFGSEVPAILARNPNLNFDVAIPPQGSDSTVRRTYGTFYSLVIPRASRNTQGAFRAARVLASAEHAQQSAATLNVVPASRAALARGTADPYAEVSYQAALFARGWLSPQPIATEGILQTMVEDITSNRAQVSEAAADAISRLSLEY